MPTIQPPLFHLQSHKRDDLTSMTAKLGRSDTDKTPEQIASDKGNSTTNSTNTDGKKTT